MIKILSLIFLFCLIFPYAFGQTQNLILTTEQNNEWLDSLETLSLDQQLSSIRKRFLSDTNVFIQQNHSDGFVDSLGDRVYGDGKPTLIVSGYPMIIDNKTQTNKIISLTNLLTKTYIKKISIINPSNPATAAIYGSPRKSGIIIITLTKRKYTKLFQRLELKPNY